MEQENRGRIPLRRGDCRDLERRLETPANRHFVVLEQAVRRAGGGFLDQRRLRCDTIPSMRCLQIVVATVIALFIGVAKAQQHPSSAQGDDSAPPLRGPIFEVTETHDTPQGPWSLVTTFNADRQPTQETYTTGDGSVRIQTFSYNTEGKLIATQLASGDTTIATLARAYNDQGQLISMIRSDAQGAVLEQTAQRWDDADHLIEQVRVGGPTAGRTQWRFSEDGCQIQELQFDANGTMIHRLDQVCDDQGQVTTRSWIDGGGIVTGSSLHVFDEAGNEIMGTALDGGGAILSRWQYTRDDDGGVTAIRRFDSKGAMVDHTKFTLNENGDVKEALMLEVDGTVMSCSRVTYDEHGNTLAHTVSTTLSDDGTWIDFDVLGERAYRYHAPSPLDATEGSSDPPPAPSQEAPPKTE